MARCLCAGPHALNDLQNTPLHEAAHHGRLHVAQMLLGARAHVDVTNSRQQGELTPLLAAVEGGHASTVRLLLEHHADMFQSESRMMGGTLNHSRKGSIVSSGGPIHTWRIPHQRALNLALESKHLEVVLELLLWGWRKVKFDEKDEKPATPDQPPLGSASDVFANLPKPKYSHPMQVFTRAQVQEIIVDIWAKEQGIKEMHHSVSTRLLIMLLLSTNPESYNMESSISNNVSHRALYNPVLLALQLSNACAVAAKSSTRHRSAASKLQEVETLLEYIAAGFLQRTTIASLEAAEAQQYNLWRTGKGIFME